MKISHYLGIKLLSAPLIVLGVLTLTFILVRAAPGDPASRILDVYATPEAVENLRHQMGLDRPLHEQYVRYVTNVLTGDLGTSLQSHQPVLSMILDVLPYTVNLAVASVSIGFSLGLGLGIISAVKRGTIVDYVVSALSVLGISIPLFWLAIMFLLTFSLNLNLFPAIGAGGSVTQTLHRLVLPATVLGIQLAGLVSRTTRSSMIEQLDKMYITTVRSIGGTESRVIMHALKNSLITLVAVLSLQLGQCLGGIVVLEVVYARPGLGKLIADAIVGRDYPVAQGGIVVFAIMIILVMLISEALYGIIDPRIREERV